MHWRASAILVVSLLACATEERDASRRRDRFPTRSAITDLLASERPFEARLSGSRGWADCTRDTRTTRAPSAECPGRALDSKVMARAAEIFRASHGRPSGDAHDARWARALIDLVSSAGDPGITRSALTKLEALVAEDTTNAELYNDVAVAVLAGGQTQGDASAAFLSLEYIERAWELDSSSSVVAFNRALVFERLHLVEDASAAWERIDRVEPSPEWRAEARRHLESLRARHLVNADSSGGTWADRARRDPQAAREAALDSILPRWADAVLTNDASVTLSTAADLRSIAHTLAVERGDSAIVRVADVAASAVRECAEAVADLAVGGRLFRRQRYAEAKPVLVRAASRLRQASPATAAIAGWADLLLAAIAVYESRLGDAAAQATRIERDGIATGSVALRARALWLVALATARQGRMAQAADHYRLAGDLFDRIGETANQASMRAQRADLLFLLGQDDAALAATTEALSTFSPRAHARLRAGVLLELGRELTELGFGRAAVAVLDEAVRSAAHSGRPVDPAEALVRLATAKASIGRVNDAGRHLDSARQTLETLDPVLTARLRMEAASAAAAIFDAREPASARRELDSVVAYHVDRGIVFGRSPALARRARVRLRQADSAGAVIDLRSAIATAESLATHGTAVELREAAAVRRESHGALVALAVARGDTLGALLESERARGRHRATMPAVGRDEVVLDYFLLPDETLLWILTSSSMRMVRIPIAGPVVARVVERAEMLVRSGDTGTAWDSTSRSLYAMLVAPAERELAVASDPMITVVTDGSLGRLPFVALRDVQGRYLVERATLRYRMAVSTTPVPARGRDTLTVVVSDPAFDAALFPGLERLRGASSEAAAVAKLHDGTHFVEGAAATRSVMLDLLRRSTVFHFAGHARLVERVPQRSHLVLARGGAALDENVLAASEIARLDLRQLRLAVLSACGTTQRTSKRNADESGLTRAFLDAGAGAVISSLWAVDDQSTSVLMTRFHERLGGGMSAPAALRDAQRAMIAGGAVSREPRAWSAFRYDER